MAAALLALLRWTVFLFRFTILLLAVVGPLSSFRLFRSWLTGTLSLFLLAGFLLFLFVFIFLFTLLCCFFERFQTDQPYHVCVSQIRFFWFGGNHFYRFQVIWFYALPVKLANFLGPGDGEWVLFVTAFIGVPHKAFEDIPFLQVGNAAGSFNVISIIGEVFQRVEVGVQLVVQAAF